jgi:hypothetical protein
MGGQASLQVLWMLLVAAAAPGTALLEHQGLACVFRFGAPYQGGYRTRRMRLENGQTQVLRLRIRELGGHQED